jgi:hypothetical protein
VVFTIIISAKFGTVGILHYGPGQLLRPRWSGFEPCKCPLKHESKQPLLTNTIIILTINHLRPYCSCGKLFEIRRGEFFYRFQNFCKDSLSTQVVDPREGQGSRRDGLPQDCLQSCHFVQAPMKSLRKIGSKFSLRHKEKPVIYQTYNPIVENPNEEQGWPSYDPLAYETFKEP